MCDLGCGPGQIARYLRDRGVDSFGVDLSFGMLAQARRLNPDLAFVQSSMSSLGLRSGTLGGVAAFYCIIHIPRAQVVSVLKEIRRVLRPAGLFLVTFHLGSEDTHHEEMLGHQVKRDIAWFTTEEMSRYLQGRDFSSRKYLRGIHTLRRLSIRAGGDTFWHRNRANQVPANQSPRSLGPLRRGLGQNYFVEIAIKLVAMSGAVSWIVLRDVTVCAVQQNERLEQPVMVHLNQRHQRRVKLFGLFL